MNDFCPEKIYELRKLHKMSQKVLAKRLGITDRAVSKWENGLSQPSGQHLVYLSRIFNVPIEYFLSDDYVPQAKNISEGMESIREIYKIGRGPSSSHTIGPERACLIFKQQHPEADSYRVVLYGSLAKTGKGHGTDVVVQKTFAPIPCEVDFNVVEKSLPHPNTMDIYACKNGVEIGCARFLSVGGGSIECEKFYVEKPRQVYVLHHFGDIARYCQEHAIRIWEYALENEGEEILAYMHKIWKVMKTSIKNGLRDEGVLPGGLDVQKKAKALLASQHIDESAETRENRMVCAYAFAVGEQNAAGETIVTAPTCGAAGVVPAVLYYQQQKHKFSDDKIVQALLTAGIIGNIIKTNASISGAECGCQAEVGSACAMAAAAMAELFELSVEKFEYAAEIAIEHHLGLTCDPICGLVQIPCIERNAVAAMRAINAVSLASFLWNSRKISFDWVVNTMKETGKDMHIAYKETAEGGLAKIKIEK